MNRSTFSKLSYLVLLLSLLAMPVAHSRQASAAPSSHHMPGDERAATNPAAPVEQSSLALMFRKVDTVVVNVSFGPRVSQIAFVDYEKALSAVTDAVREIFRKDNFQIKSLTEVRDRSQEAEYQKPNVLFVTFILSARQETVAGKTIEVAALTWMFRRFDSTLTFSGSGDGVSYPFVLPDTQDERIKRIHEGVMYLAPALPDQIVCGNKIPPQCHDCALNCHMSQKYLERPASVPKQTSPGLKMAP